MGMLLQRGYNDLGIQAVLDEADVPKGSFYHHFKSKEDFALQVIDMYMGEVHKGLDACLGDTARPPLQRVRGFFEATRESYRKEGYLGCLLGGLGQELSGVSEVFRKKIEWCITAIADRLAGCLDEARRAGDLPRTPTPGRWPSCWWTAGRAPRSAPACAGIRRRCRRCSTSTSSRPPGADFFWPALDRPVYYERANP